MARLLSPDVLAILTIWQEARGEEQEGRIAIGEVIRNRMIKTYSSDGTVEGTVLKPYQFSGWNTGDYNRIKCAKLLSSDPVVIECTQAWYRSKETNVTNGAVLYYNPKVIKQPPQWVANCTQVATVGNHVFFVPKI